MIPWKALFPSYAGTLVAIAGALAASGCAGEDQPSGQTKPGPGVIFTYPFDGQMDVPTGAAIVVTLTDPVDESALGQTCALAGDSVTGGLCVRGPEGLVSVTTEVLAGGKVIRMLSSELRPGTAYQVYAAPALIDTGAVNITAGTPLFGFHTRSEGIIGGQAPAILAINGDDPASYAPGDAGDKRFPFLDFSTIRVLFSEPLDPATVALGSTVDLLEIDPATGAEMPVPSSLLVQGIHVTVDPDSDLVPEATYRLRFASGIVDLGGEPMDAEAEYEFVPLNTRTDDPLAGTDEGLNEGLIKQVLSIRSPADDSAVSVAGIPANTVQMSHPLVGNNQLAANPGTVIGHMGDPAAFGGLIPITIRKGQLLTMSGLEVALGGVVPTGLNTGDVTVRFISDASGYLVRNPYRAPEQIPDDAVAPVYLYLTFDVAVSAASELGNAVLNQTVMNVQASGISTISGKALAIETAGAMELDLLGATKAPSNLVLRMETTPDATAPGDTEAPRLVTAYPAQGQETVAVDDQVLLTFSEALDPASVTAENMRLERSADGALVGATLVLSGTTVLIQPSALLEYGTPYVVRLGEDIRDRAGNTLLKDGSGPMGNMDMLLFGTHDLVELAPTRVPAPVLTSLYPGVPCALTGATSESPGRCTSTDARNAGDSLYRPFTLPQNRYIDAYFNQPMDTATLVLGTECGMGSIRVETTGESGDCTGVVPGTLAVRERGFRFVPAQPWVVGQAYRLTLVAGADAICEPGEICAADIDNDPATDSRRPLNTDPLNGTAITATRNGAGGPDLVIPFTGAAATPDTYVASLAGPVTDVNGNGQVDVGEVRHSANLAANKILGYGGAVTQAAIPHPDAPPTTATCTNPDLFVPEGYLYVNAVMPVSIQDVANDCPIGEDATGNSITVEQCIAAEVYPQIIFGTSLRLCLDVLLGGEPATLNRSTGQLVLRMRDDLENPPVGYIYSDPQTGEPRFTAKLEVYMDAPDLDLVDFGIEHDLHSKPLTLVVAGPVRFVQDGRIQIDVVNTEDVLLAVNITNRNNPTFRGNIDMQIPKGQMKLQLLSQHRQAGLVRRALLP